MSLKGQKTSADYLDWETLRLLLLKLQRDKEYRFCLFIAIGSFCGLRISDILALKWSDLINETTVKGNVTIVESKTKKTRQIRLNPDLQKIILECFYVFKERFEDEEKKIKAIRRKAYKEPLPFITWNIFLSQERNVLSRQYINQQLKVIKQWYELPIDNFSSHSLRKTFGREVWKKNDYSDKALILLSEIFDHANCKITKRYLGIKDEEITNVYDSLTL